MDNETGMALALEQAQRAYEQGEFPVGCVIVQADKVVATGSRKGTVSNKEVFSEIDHAEIRGLKALEVLPVNMRRSDLTLFCTMEPCLMCYAAIMLSGIKEIVYAYEDPMGGGTGIDLSVAAPLYKNSKIKVIPGIMRQKSLDLFYKFFNKEANLYWKDSYLETYTREQFAIGEKNK